MAEQRKKDSDTPVSKEMKEQQRAGQQGLAGSEGSSDKQPRQGSRRVEGAGPPPQKERFEEGQRPSEQGDGSPKPRNVAEEPSQQGLAGRSGSGAGSGGRGDTEATQD